MERLQLRRQLVLRQWQYIRREHEFSIYNDVRRSAIQTSDEAGRQQDAGYGDTGDTSR